MTVTLALPDRPYSQPAHRTQALPFRVRLAEGQADLEKALRLRSLAYGRHIPALASGLAQAEADDLRTDTLLLLAECHSTGQLLGSLRLINNLHGRLQIEEETRLPARFDGLRLVEARRLTVLPGQAGHMVSTALSKALYEVCFHSEMDEVLITARSPVDKMYRLMQFDDVLGGHPLHLPDVSGLPHGLYALPVRQADARWRQADCPLYGFMARTRHPDIQIDYQAVHRRFSGRRIAEKAPVLSPLDA